MQWVEQEGPLGGLTNMARDQLLLTHAEAGQPAARVYGWSGPWVSLGRFQRVRDALRPGTSVPWVRRPTGGRAVLHGHDVTVGMALPLRNLKGVRQVYPVVIGLLVDAMRAAGAEVVLGQDYDGPQFEKSRSADCFATVSPNDIVDVNTGQKVCGCALRLTDRAVLVQASIPVRMPLIDPESAYLHPAPIAAIDLVGRALAEALNQRLIHSFASPAQSVTEHSRNTELDHFS